LAFCLTACTTYGERATTERSIAVADLPANIRAAAEKAVPGIVIEEAEVETENGVDVYEVEGGANGKEYEIEIGSSGEVLEIEEEVDDAD
jgi:uncharacterized membrane protein YkoI